VKTGDAKLWVYRHLDDHDRQAAEDCNAALLYWPGLLKPGFFIRMAISTFNSFNF
jgi:hypothetical protein